jgi:hypothetical protein
MCDTQGWAVSLFDEEGGDQRQITLTEFNCLPENTVISGSTEDTEAPIKGFITGQEFQVNFVIEEDELIYFRGVLNPDMTQICGTWGNEPQENRGTFLCTHESHAEQAPESNVKEREAFHVDPYQS